MKYTLGSLACLALSATNVVAFPAAMFDAMAKRGIDSSKTDLKASLAEWKAKRATVGFDAATQVSFTMAAPAVVLGG